MKLLKRMCRLRTMMSWKQQRIQLEQELSVAYRDSMAALQQEAEALEVRDRRSVGWRPWLRHWRRVVHIGVWFVCCRAPVCVPLCVCVFPLTLCSASIGRTLGLSPGGHEAGGGHH